MKKGILTGIIALTALIVFFSIEKEGERRKPVADDRPPAALVAMTPEGFIPTTTRVKAGDIVRFVNEDADWRWPASDLHPTHELYPDFDPGKPIIAGDDWDFQFKEKGSWRFHDHLKPNKRGTVIVE